MAGCCGALLDLASEQFEAFTFCPKCGVGAVHRLRPCAPKPEGSRPEPPAPLHVDAGSPFPHDGLVNSHYYGVVRDIDTYRIETWGGERVRQVPAGPVFELPPEWVRFDREQQFSIFRVCECGHEWGQK